MHFSRARTVSPRLDVVASSPSTNSELRERLTTEGADSWPHLSVLLTDNQSSGKGRLDRTWHTPPGTALAISVVLDVQHLGAELRGWLPLVAGLAMRHAIAQQCQARTVSVKWPNDILIGERKICGILAEVVDTQRVIIGTGVNTAMTTEQAPAATATSFAMEGTTCDADRLLSDYLQHLDSHVKSLIRAGNASSSGILSEARQHCSTLGQKVRVMLPHTSDLHGTAHDIADDGRIIVRTENGDHTISAGDIVHLRAQ
ncbi:biotin--[acetyl-CoA-carboxylase] ligase [Microbacterium sp. YY-01]|uniref:biotin--[acetyl-CoA-carboxylase] ligase n=1 Tax=Microbacterium sp. YY-01 TaxID=3421634 RepID=UPI003D1669D1